MKYSRSRRWKTSVVHVGNIAIGGDNPIRIQSMTTTNTCDIEKTVLQVKELADAGCEIVRMTVQGKKEAFSLEKIKNSLLQSGYTIPLVADIHFYPPAAMVAADFVDKIRINPGNFLDLRASFKIIEYTDESYLTEIAKIEEGFSPLVQKCKERNIAMRIGTNHGSLSDRIMNRYGDTSRGMVESALEYAKVCRQNDFHNFLFSMKASNPLVMQEAYRLLVDEMKKMGWNYPLHLGVTEAGNCEDGRVKSAVGIGALLLDGLGDTVRVSLTEDPVREIDPCKRLVELAKYYEVFGASLESSNRIKRSISFNKTLLHRDGSVFLKLTKEEFLLDTLFQDIGCKLVLGRVEKRVDTVDALVVDTIDEDMRVQAQALEKAQIPLIALDNLSKVLYINEQTESAWESKIYEGEYQFILFELRGDKVNKGREFFRFLEEREISLPVILLTEYEISEDDLVIRASAELGSLLSEGKGDGVCINANFVSIKSKKNLSFSILQAARMRSSKTEFIACPGCGRTLFDLQKVTKLIQEKTSHLPGVKIAIMGCIVNGPGEMADADFGFVGSKSKMVDLYVEKKCVEKHIPFEDAPDRLIELIKKHGRWQEPGTLVQI